MLLLIRRILRSHHPHNRISNNIETAILTAIKKMEACMRQRSILVSMAVLVIGLALAYSVFAQQPAQGQRQGQPAAQGQRQGQAGRGGRAPLFFREEWKQTPAGGEHPVTPAEAVANPNL